MSTHPFVTHSTKECCTEFAPFLFVLVIQFPLLTATMEQKRKK